MSGAEGVSFLPFGILSGSNVIGTSELINEKCLQSNYKGSHAAMLRSNVNKRFLSSRHFLAKAH